MTVAFIGAGRWALALALKLTERGHATRLYEPNRAALDRLLGLRRHPDLPETATLPESAFVSPDQEQVLSGAEFAVFATPSDQLAAAAAVTKLPPTTLAVVSATKGIDPKTCRRMSSLLEAAFPSRPVVVLAGPGIPWNVAAGDPTSLVAASADEAAAALVRDTFAGGNLRIYSHPDITGVELAAAFKNVIAIAAGVADGIGLGINAKAALLTRGLAEITRLGLAHNCNPLTFSGLSGMGDLIVTAFSEHSRNHNLGRLLGQGLALEQARAGLAGVAEGATTARTGLELSRRLSVEMPITEEVHRMLYEGVQPAESLERLLKRRPKKEVWQ